MNASRLRWTELKRKGPWQAHSDEDNSEKLDIVIGVSASPPATPESDDENKNESGVNGNSGSDTSPPLDLGALLGGFFISNGAGSALICHARHEWRRASQYEGRSV